VPERLIGRTLGKYRVESLLGTGGFAWVFAAADPDLDIVVALKVLKPQYAGDAEFEDRFKREASTAAKLKHPNIIKIYAVGAEQQSAYFAMDLYAHKLTQQIQVMGCLPEPSLLKLGLDISSALGFAHRQGVIHRDIKTDNILFDDHGNAIVADFGIARAAADYAEHTGTNVIMGTPQFFAPEQARGLKVDARADIYSLGVTLYVAATGELPFSGTDWYDIATKHVHEAPRPPRSLNPLISAEMERIILKCLEKDPDNRYSSADLLYAEFETLARRRAGEDNATTIMVATPVTGRNQTIRPAGGRGKSRALSTLAYLFAFAGAAGIFAAVDHRSVRPVYTARSAGTEVWGDSQNASPDSSIQLSADSGTAAAATAGGRRAGGSPPATGVARYAFTVNAPGNASIVVNGTVVGVGSWHVDTLPGGNYRVTAQLPMQRECEWGKDSTLVVLSETGPQSISLSPQLCGSMLLSATRGEGGSELIARYDVRSDSGALIKEGRLPYGQSIVLPAGTHQLTISATLCLPFRGSLVIQPDSITPRLIRMTCGNMPSNQRAP
jgi:serine/threonine-protein kinase